MTLSPSPLIERRDDAPDVPAFLGARPFVITEPVGARLDFVQET